VKRILAVFALALLSISTISVPLALAHAQVVSQSPAPSSEISSLPSQVAITFNEKLISLGDGNQLQMLDPDGDEVTVGEVITTESSITRELISSTKPGEYYVSYRAVSSDGHVVAGEYTFNLIQEAVSVVESPAVEDENGESGRNLLVSFVAFMLLLTAGLVFWKIRAKK
jgi:methionine-rich copper-binding protein CopC